MAKMHDGGPAATPAIADGAVYTYERTGTVKCFDAKTGVEKWSFNVPKELGVKNTFFGAVSSPLVTGKLVVVELGVIVAIDKASGKLRWKSKPYRAGNGSSMTYTHDGKIRIASLNEDGLVILDPSDGSEICRHDWRCGNNQTHAATPIEFGGMMFVSSGYGLGSCLLNISSGIDAKVVWDSDQIGNQFANSIFCGGHLYGPNGNFGGEGAPIQCVRTSDKKLLWQEDSIKNASLILAGDKFIILTDAGELISAEFSPDGCKEIARSQILGKTCWTAPILSNGLLYCRNSKGRVVCLDVRKE